MKFSNLSEDLVDQILTCLPDFRSLSAAIRTSKGMYNVFQDRPRSITIAVAQNSTGHSDVLPAALRLVRRKLAPSNDHQANDDDEQHTPEPPPDEAQVMGTPLMRAEAKLLDDNAPVVRGLEDIFSWRHKDRTSSTSRLTPTESLRFRRAVYRFWLYCETYAPPEVYFDDDDDEEVVSSRLTLRIDFLSMYSAEELYELARAASFCAQLLKWTASATQMMYHGAPYESVSWFRDISSMGPRCALQGFRSLTAEEPENPEEGFFWTAYQCVLDRAKVSAQTREEKLSNAILDEVVGAQDHCHRCHAVRGLELWGPANWSLLRGALNPPTLCTLLPGLLPRCAYETGLILAHMRSTPYNHAIFNYDKLMQELFDVPDDGQDVWAREGWYCVECVRELCRQRLWLWWRMRKQQLGYAMANDCWYGYNCRTQTHKFDHARKLNHLCVPTRGDGVTPLVRVTTHGA